MCSLLSPINTNTSLLAIYWHFYWNEMMSEFKLETDQWEVLFQEWTYQCFPWAALSKRPLRQSLNSLEMDFFELLQDNVMILYSMLVLCKGILDVHEGVCNACICLCVCAHVSLHAYFGVSVYQAVIKTRTWQLNCRKNCHKGKHYFKFCIAPHGGDINLVLNQPPHFRESTGSLFYLWLDFRQ